MRYLRMRIKWYRAERKVRRRNWRSMSGGNELYGQGSDIR